MKTAQYPRILAFDYGLKHIGVAFSESWLPEPLVTLEHWSQIKPLIHRLRPDKLLVGLPSGPLVPQVKQFAERLKSEFKLPVVLYPETLSTQEAIQRLRRLGSSRHKLKNDHIYAAAVILEDYLESLEKL